MSPASPAAALTFTADELAKLKAGGFKAGIAMQALDSPWNTLQVEALTKTLKEYGIEVLYQNLLGALPRIDEAALYRVVVADSSKAYLHREVDAENREGLFLSYKRLCRTVADLITAMYATSAILGAIEQRHVSGKGQYIDIALLDCLIALTSFQALNWFVSGEVPQRLGDLAFSRDAQLQRGEPPVQHREIIGFAGGFVSLLVLPLYVPILIFGMSASQGAQAAETGFHFIGKCVERHTIGQRVDMFLGAVRIRVHQQHADFIRGGELVAEQTGFAGEGVVTGQRQDVGIAGGVAGPVPFQRRGAAGRLPAARQVGLKVVVNLNKNFI